jgi:hypothetical protein
MARDPRTIITPDAFTVAPELLGIALARPGRRLAAIAVDGVAAAILAKSGIALLLALFAALLAWRAVGGPIERMVRGRSRIIFRVASVIFAVIVVVNLYGLARDAFGRAAQPERAADAEVTIEGEAGRAIEDLDLGVAEVTSLAAQMARLERGDSAETVERATQLGRWVVEHTEPGDQRVELADALSSGVPPAAQPAFRAAVGSDSVPADTVARLLAANARLERANDRLRDETESLREQDERRGGVTRFLSSISDDLGVGLGWFALYFTAFVVLGRGQTPGKWLLGIRIIRLDNRPLGWWLAFERFGGYAASFSTGLLGFAQILWDRNRQALHDKATETVVIRLKDGQPLRL